MKYHRQSTIQFQKLLRRLDCAGAIAGAVATGGNSTAIAQATASVPAVLECAIGDAAKATSDAKAQAPSIGGASEQGANPPLPSAPVTPPPFGASPPPLAALFGSPPPLGFLGVPPPALAPVPLPSKALNIEVYLENYVWTAESIRAHIVIEFLSNGKLSRVGMPQD